jgi:conjugative transfer signal peptidase TraF
MLRRGLPRLRLTGAIIRPPKPHRRRWAIPTTVATTLVGLAAIGFSTWVRPTPRLVWNASASAPLGIYWVIPGAVARGALVLAELPTAARRLADERGYLPARVLLVKRVAALAGDVVCSDGEAVSINRQVVARRLSADAKGRPLPAWTGCRTLRADEVFLLRAGVPNSFDGRYFGPVHAVAVIGRLVPLWTW